MFLDDCKEHFETDCLYELLGVAKDCDAKALKKGYYRQSMRWHPDKSELDEEAKKTYTIKFQLLNRAYQVLSDTDRRKIYDETGSVDDEVGKLDEDVLKAWRNIFKKVTKEDIDNYLKKYCGSEEQKTEMIETYNKYKGDFCKIRECVIGFEDVEDLKVAFDTLIAEGCIESTKKYEITTTEKKMKAFKRKAEKEATEAENLLQDNSDLVALIQSRQKERGSSFLDALEAKYSAPSSSKKAKRQ